jgi:hypothetical protein
MLLAEHSSGREDIMKPTFGSAAALAGKSAGPPDNMDYVSAALLARIAVKRDSSATGHSPARDIVHLLMPK